MEKLNKWKPVVLLLNAAERNIYYLDASKRSPKPKHVFDLSLTALYPAHESLTGRCVLATPVRTPIFMYFKIYT